MAVRRKRLTQKHQDSERSEEKKKVKVSKTAACHCLPRSPTNDSNSSTWDKSAHDGTRSMIAASEDFTKASFSYRLRAWIAMLGLLLFLVLYVGLASWFTYTAYRMIAGMFAGGGGAVAGFFAALPSAFLAIFMWKALFFIRHGSEKPGVEITAKEQPGLFQFLHEVADEIGAPRPHRVFLSPQVNAAVFYDLSILNFILPSKKNLIIGLGLVNSLNRSEFKAVLAHEFGHFAQRSMAVGRWVYVGEQIASHIIAKRDILDRSLDFISNIDLRVAWIGWIMRIVVWSIRSLMETVFKLVIIAQRALSREMEFQADLVAVSVTGSDALVHALYRLQPADEDWERSISFANSQLAKRRIVTDLYAIQSRIAWHMRRILNEPNYGSPPDLPVTGAASHRVFTQQIAQPPRMWSTHPPNTQREANAKRTYIPAPLDDEPAWSLFRQPQPLRESATAFVFEGTPLNEDFTPMPTEQAIAALDEQYSDESYDPKYRGAYLGRPVTIGVAEAGQLQSDPPPRDQIAESLDGLYPERLHETLTEWRNLDERVTLLEAVQDGIYDASGGTISHQGETVHQSHLPELISRVKQERDDALAEIEAHDKRCRTVHSTAARYVAHGWQEYLDSLTRLLHYAEHSEADLDDAYGHLANVTSLAIASGRASAGKVRRVIVSANDLQSVMAKLDRQTESVVLPQSIATHLDVGSWREAIDKLELPPADQQNIGDWINVVESWVAPMRARFGSLRKSVLAELLTTERRVAAMYRGEEEPCQAPEAAQIPDSYATRPPASVRERQKKLDWWSRFTLADGTGPAILRFAVAASLVAMVVTAGMFVGSAKVIVYNGLSVPVKVQLNHHHVSVQPFRHKSLSAGVRRSGQIETHTADGQLIESFEATLDKGFANYVYNVAGAAPMVQWTAVYGNVRPRPPQPLGCPRWQTSGADHIFTDPPREIKSSGSGGSRTVLSSYPEMHPQQIMDMVTDPAERNRVILTHAKWDASDAIYLDIWLTMASELDSFDDAVSHRLARNPKDIMTLRVQQDTADEKERDNILQQHLTLSKQHPDDPDWQYIGARAMADGIQQDQAFLGGRQKWPDHVWFNYAAGVIHLRQSDWHKAQTCFDVLLQQRGPTFRYAASRVARLRRYTAEEESPDLSDLQDSFELQSMLTLESGEGLRGTPMAAYSHLAGGRVEEAYRVAGAKEADQRVLILLAASKGAHEEWQQRALQIPVDEISDSTLLMYLAGLAFRLQQPYDRFLDELEGHYQNQPISPRDFLQQLIQQPPSTSLEDELTGLDLVERGEVLATAIIMYPDGTPPSWRESVRKLLFAAERPAF